MKRTGRTIVVGGISILLAAPALAQTQRQYAIIDFSSRPADQVSAGWGINARGAVAGRFSHGNYTRGGLWYRNSVDFFKPFASSRFMVSDARGLNDLDQVVGFAMINEDYFQRHAALWDGATSIDLGTTGGEYSEAYAINNLGQVVGMSVSAIPDVFTDAFLWQSGVMIALPRFSQNAHANEAWDINDRGQIVGLQYSDDGEGIIQSALLWDNGVPTRLEPLVPNHHAFAWAINDVGQIAGASEVALDQAVIWENGVPRNIDNFTFGQTSTLAHDINNVGQVVGTAFDVFYDDFAWIWQNDKMQRLADFVPPRSGWVLDKAWAINDSGQITGSGDHGPANFHAFMMSPVTPEMTLSAPEPGLAGQENTVSITNCIPGERVYLMYGTNGGGTYVPGCDVLAAVVQIETADVAGSAVADALGTTVIQVMVPASRSGAKALLQAVNRSSCQESQLIDVVFE